MGKPIVEKHISVDTKLHERLKKVAEKTRRSMRGALEVMIAKAEEELKDSK